MRYVVKLFAVACEKDCSCPRSVSNADDIALNVLLAIVRRCERLVVAPMAVRFVGQRCFMPSYICERNEIRCLQVH